MLLVFINKANRIAGGLRLPGDKSISHRAAMLAAMASGETRIENFATSVDCSFTLSCLANLGVEINREGASVTVKGAGKTGFKKPAGPFDCGNSGTTMRLLAGILAGQRFNSVLTGDESLHKRPMKRVIEPLMLMGAKIETNDGRAPLNIFGGNRLHGIEYRLPVASAQIKSCVMLAGLNASGETSVIEPTTTRDHTERMLRWFGVDVHEEETRKGKRLTVSSEEKLTAKDLLVPGDISSAAFFMVAAACLPGSELVIENIGLNPSRTAIIDTLKQLGADIHITNERIAGNEPVGDLTVGGELKSAIGLSSNVVKGEIIANLIDEIPILAVFGTQLENGLEVRDAGELRLKESDRIASVVENLKRMGAVVDEFTDGFRVECSELKGATIDSFGDHRISMAFAVAGLFAEGRTEILGAECADVSFPGFYNALAAVVK